MDVCAHALAHTNLKGDRIWIRLPELLPWSAFCLPFLRSVNCWVFGTYRTTGWVLWRPCGPREEASPRAESLRSTAKPVIKRMSFAADSTWATGVGNIAFIRSLW